MTPELRLIRYFVVVAATGNITRAAQQLHISQPSLSAAIKQLEAQLGVELLARQGRTVTITPAGELLARRGQELLEIADAVADEVRHRHRTASGRLRLGVSPTARYGIAAELLEACFRQAPAAMLYVTENTTGALLRDVAQGELELAITFCAGPSSRGLELKLLRQESAIVHMPADHPLASRSEVSLLDIAEDTILIASSQDSAGFTDRVLGAFNEVGIMPHTRADPYPDLGVQAVREGLGIVIYARSAFPAAFNGSVFVALRPPLGLPFHLAFRPNTHSAAIRAVISVADQISAPDSRTVRPTATSAEGCSRT